MKLAALGLAFGLLLPSVALAQTSDDTRAHGHFLAGSSYINQGRYDEAAEQFETAYSLSPRPELLLNVATSYERGGHLARAADAIERYLTAVPDSSEVHTLTERMARLRARAAEQEAATVATATPAPAPTPTPTPPPPTAPPVHHDNLGTLGIVGIIIAGVGVLAGGAALGTGLAADGNYQTLDRTCGPMGNTCPAGSAAMIDQGSALATASTALTVVSLVAVAAGATLFIIDLTDGSGSDSQVAVGVGPGDVGLSVRWSL